MMMNSISLIFERDLKKLKEEISLYKNETDLWMVKGDIKNSGGNLSLHLIGNLNYFIGSILGKTGYERNREAEFTLKNISKENILKEIDLVSEMVIKTLNLVHDENLTNPFPVEFLGERKSILDMLLILSTHFSYHLGQINYHRRFISVD